MRFLGLRLEVTIRPPAADTDAGRKAITRKLNEVYTGDYYKEFEPIADAVLESLREITKNRYKTGSWDGVMQRAVTVGSFYMGRTEVAQKDYQALMGTNPSAFKGGGDAGSSPA